MQLHHFRLGIFALVMLLPAYATRATTVIDMQPGNGNSTTDRDIGQSFTVPSNGDRTLDAYQLLLGPNVAGTVHVQMFIYPFDKDNGKLIGAPLYSSGVQNISSFPSPVSFPTHLTLNPGGVYAAIVQQKSLGNGSITMAWRTNISVFSNFVDYPGGDQIFTDDSPPWTNTVWLARTQADDPNFKADMTFVATFTPEPSLLPCVVGATACARLRRRGVTSASQRA